MLQTFLATLTPMLTLFLCIAVGFVSAKTKILPDTASKTMAKMETWIFCPALSFMTMVRFCTVDTISTHATNIVMAAISVSVAMIIAIPLAKVFVRENTPERGVYAYALAFANSGYVGDPIVLALFGEEGLAYYKLFCLPLSIVIYTWGISVLTPKTEEKGSTLKRLCNAPTVAMLIGIAVFLLVGWSLRDLERAKKFRYLAAVAGIAFLLVTLAFGEIVKTIFENTGTDTFGGPIGLRTPRFDKQYLFIFGFVLVLFTLFVIQNLIRSKHGRAITAIRDNEIAARATGINVTKYKLIGFIIGCIAITVIAIF